MVYDIASEEAIRVHIAERWVQVIPVPQTSIKSLERYFKSCTLQSYIYWENKFYLLFTMIPLLFTKDKILADYIRKYSAILLYLPQLRDKIITVRICIWSLNGLNKYFNQSHTILMMRLF